MKAIDAFQDTIDRAEHLLDIYDLLHNTRRRKIRADWAPKFNKVMGWKQSEKLCRVDGNNCVLVIKGDDGWEMEHFEHEWLGELLRSALAMAVSALDRYLHVRVVDSMAGWFGKSPQSMPAKMAEIDVPFAIVEECLQKALASRKKNGANTRPRTILKKALREALYTQTFQSARNVESAFSLMGFKKPWSNLQKETHESPEKMMLFLNKLTKRRNQIVHEGDIRNIDRIKSVELNDISRTYVFRSIQWLRTFVGAIETTHPDF